MSVAGGGIIGVIIGVAVLVGVAVLIGVVVLVIVLATQSNNAKKGNMQSVQWANPQPQPVQQENPQPASSVTRILVATGGQYGGARFKIETPITIGSDRQQCNILFGADVPEICSVHCEITCENGVVHLTDKGASFSTMVNEERILRANESIELNIGDSFRIGTHETFIIE